MTRVQSDHQRLLAAMATTSSNGRSGVTTTDRTEQLRLQKLCLPPTAAVTATRHSHTGRGFKELIPQLPPPAMMSEQQLVSLSNQDISMTNYFNNSHALLHMINWEFIMEICKQQRS